MNLGFGGSVGAQMNLGLVGSVGVALRIDCPHHPQSATSPPRRFYSGATQEVTRKIAKIGLGKLAVLCDPWEF